MSDPVPAATTASREILKVEGLSAGYGPLRVLHDLDLSVHAQASASASSASTVTASPRCFSPSPG
jgi:hypothetical protein